VKKVEKRMVNYQEGRIYKLTVDGSNLVYYGSTTQPLWRRMQLHRSQYQCNKTQCTSKELFEVGTPIITLVEKFPCNSKEELHSRERFYIENNPCVNKCIPGRTPEEYKHTENRKETCVKYYQNNKDRYHEQYLENKDKKKAYDKEYREKNKERIIERITQMIDCECGQSYQKTHKAGHEKTETHQTWIKTGNQKTFNQIIIQCECGGTYQDWTKNRHFKTLKHLNHLTVSS